MGSKSQDKLKRLYEEMPRDEALRQGRQHLANDAARRVRRTRRILVAVQWTLALLALAAIGAGAMLLLFKAKESSSAFGRKRAGELEHAIER